MAKKKRSTPKERAVTLGIALIHAMGIDPSELTAGDVEEASNESVVWVNNTIGPNESYTSIDAVTATIGAVFNLHCWE